MRARHAVLGLAAALTACGAPAPSQPPPSTAASPTPVPGVTVRTDAFTTVMPPGWSSTGQTPAAVQAGTGGSVVLQLSAPPPSPAGGPGGDLAASIEVVELLTPVADDRLATTLAAATDRGAINLSIAKPAYVDGAPGLSVTYDVEAGTVPAETEELLVNHGGSTWDITCTAPVAAWSAARPGLLVVLTAWHWTT